MSYLRDEREIEMREERVQKGVCAKCKNRPCGSENLPTTILQSLSCPIKQESFMQEVMKMREEKMYEVCGDREREGFSFCSPAAEEGE